MHRLAVFFQTTPDTLPTELEKILLHAGDVSEISAESIRDIISTSHYPESRDFTDAVLGQDKAQFFNCIQHLDTESLIPTIRTLYGSFLRIHHIHCLMSESQSFEQVISKLSPPPFFKEKAALKQHINLWPKRKIEALLESLKSLEADIKNGKPGMKEHLSVHLSQALIQ